MRVHLVTRQLVREAIVADYHSIQFFGRTTAIYETIY